MLRQFIGPHPEFAWRPKDAMTNRGMIVMWGLPGTDAAGAADAIDSAALLGNARWRRGAHNKNHTNIPK